MKKALSLLLAVIALLSSMFVMTYAAQNHDDEVAPCYNNTTTARVSFGINSSGRASATITCTGIGGVTTKIVAESKIQKKFGLIWINVSGASWTDTVNGQVMSKTHTHQLEKTGTYRVKATITVSGRGGANDVINSAVEDTY